MGCCTSPGCFAAGVLPSRANYLLSNDSSPFVIILPLLSHSKSKILPPPWKPPICCGEASRSVSYARCLTGILCLYCTCTVHTYIFKIYLTKLYPHSFQQQDRSVGKKDQWFHQYEYRKEKLDTRWAERWYVDLFTRIVRALDASDHLPRPLLLQDHNWGGGASKLCLHRAARCLHTHPSFIQSARTA